MDIVIECIKLITALVEDKRFQDLYKELLLPHSLLML